VHRVLVIDDHEPNVMLYGKVITKIPQAEAIPFTSARAALTWADINDPALIVVDQQMPEMPGLEFIRLVRELRGRAETPIIMITGQSDKELRREALKRGASAFLNKPVDPIEFLAIAANFIKARALRLDAQAHSDQLAAQVRALSAELETRDRELIDALVRTAELRDKRLADHMTRTALIAERIGTRIGLSQLDVQQLAVAARIYDIGKLAVPDRVLYKSGKLTSDERALATKHAADGYELLRGGHSPLIKLAAEIARSHHERFDGTGYPGNLRGEAIPRAARIVGVADAFAAMTANRPWRDALSVGIALDEIERESGGAFEPRLVGALREVMPDVLEIRAKVPDLLR
jgi:putative two-component system response regulator